MAELQWPKVLFLASCTFVVADDNVASFSRAYNKFGVRLFQHDMSWENKALSPISVSSLLSMLAAGTGGTTKQEILHTLHLSPALQTNFQALFFELQNGIQASFDNYTVQLSQKIYTATNVELTGSYKRILHKYFNASVESFDFTVNPEAALQHINAWAARMTRNNIQKALDVSPGLMATCKMLLINVFYFYAIWRLPFDEEATKLGGFRLTGEKTVDVAMMKMENTFLRARKFNDFTVVELPYHKDAANMYIMVPHETEGLAQLVKNINGSFLTDLPSRLVEHEVKSLLLPKFKMKISYQLNSRLHDLGIWDIFLPGKADLRPMIGDRRKLAVQSVTHTAHVEVHESGTEASASSSAIVALARKPELTLAVDRPFFFFIRESTFGAVIFMGSVYNPLQSEEVLSLAAANDKTTNGQGTHILGWKHKYMYVLSFMGVIFVFNMH